MPREKLRISKVKLREMMLTKNAQSVSANKATQSSCLAATCVFAWIVEKAFRNRSTICAQYVEELFHLLFRLKDEEKAN